MFFLCCVTFCATLLFSVKKKKSSGFGWKQRLAQWYSTSLCDIVISKFNFSWRWNSPCGVVATLFSRSCHTYIPILRITALENTFIFSFSILVEGATYNKCKMYRQANDENTWWKRQWFSSNQCLNFLWSESKNIRFRKDYTWGPVFSHSTGLKYRQVENQMLQVRAAHLQSAAWLMMPLCFDSSRHHLAQLYSSVSQWCLSVDVKSNLQTG